MEVQIIRLWLSPPCNGGRDGLLAAWWDARLGTDKHIQPKPGELENYFKEHKEEYAWDLPHFKGAVIHCQNRKGRFKN